MKILNLKSIILIIVGGISIYFGATFTFLLAIGIWNYFFYRGDYGSFGTFMFTFGWIGIPFLVMGIVIFYKSPIIKYLLGYIEK
jgi:type IV secretory pathway VirB2 component (pilin)